MGFKQYLKEVYSKENFYIDDFKKIYEIYQEEPDSTFTHDGVEYYLNSLLKITHGQEIVFINTDKLKWILSEDSHEDRIKKADVKAPILITEWRNKWVVIDGFHRLQRAVRDGVKQLPCRIVTTQQLNRVKLKGKLK